MAGECEECQELRGEIKRLKNEIYNLCKSNISSQRSLEDRYTKQVQNLENENFNLGKIVQEYKEYKENSENYFKDVNMTLLVAKSKLGELQDRINVLERTNSDLRLKYEETRSLLSVLIDQGENGAKCLVSTKVHRNADYMDGEKNKILSCQ
ncbi:hypothetical protein HWI79_3720 [Cryptosporidium felis]|nr:hypothetical protein HWI79_3720 [Cryptosporidium felis]